MRLLLDSHVLLWFGDAQQALDAARLPRHHNDPFDRILVAQAQSEAAVLVTHDDMLSAYSVPVMRADD